LVSAEAEAVPAVATAKMKILLKHNARMTCSVPAANLSARGIWRA
jgi:hypothetical protein